MLHGTIVSATLLHKKSIRVTWRLQTIFNATFVAATYCTTLNRLQIPTTLLQQIDCRVTRYHCSRNNVALKIVRCNLLLFNEGKHEIVKNTRWEMPYNLSYTENSHVVCYLHIKQIAISQERRAIWKNYRWSSFIISRVLSNKTNLIFILYAL